MAFGTVHLALFNENQIDEAAEAISRLRDLGIGDEDISVISGIPLSDRMLGRPMTWTRVPIIAGVGAITPVSLWPSCWCLARSILSHSGRNDAQHANPYLDCGHF
jgi:hypothetical protein